MRKQLYALALVVVLVFTFSGVGRTQDKPVNKPPLPTLKIQVVISKFQGEKKLSSLPYMLSVHPGSRATIRMGTQIPVASATQPMVDGKPVAGPGFMTGPISFTYRDVGTNIDCLASPAFDDGWFKLEIGIQETSIFPGNEQVEGAGKAPGVPSFRTYGSTNTLMLKDGQSAQFTTAADRISGEVLRADVTLTVVK